MTPHVDIQSYDRVIFTAMMYSYFLLDTVGRQALISANNQLIRRSDELWVFGPISTGVQKEVELAKSLNMPVKYFKTTIDPTCEFEEIDENSAICETDPIVLKSS